MTDRELLQWAAKASGVAHIDGQYHETLGLTRYPGEGRWNPLTDDGDALRLAVTLRLLVDVTADGAGAQALNVAWCSEPYGTDPYAATRRAIVRAAAEIGMAMSEKPADPAAGG